MKIQKGSLLALYAALELGQEPERQLSTADIAAKYGVSAHHLAKVMRHLVRSGLIQAVRGVGGGYRFAGNPRRTTLLEVIQLFEPMESTVELAGTAGAAATPVIAELRSIAGEIDELTRAVLDTITLRTLLNAIERRAKASAPSPPRTGRARQRRPA
ncbi:MAG: Rrf2 family transcriptional regulator [Gammaproteobacteria bacterium]|nr:Rrf2 family transcriptional regulator [Gammaproteobacteria bacterium]